MASIPPEKAPKPGLNIYGCPAVNPVKLTIAAEELGYVATFTFFGLGPEQADSPNRIPYNFINLDMAAGELTSEWFKSINPNGRAPAIVHVKEDGTSVTVFESGACLLYIASEFDREHKLSYPVGTPAYWSQLSWVSSYHVVAYTRDIVF